MCLSTALRDSDPNDVLMEMVQSIAVDGEKITLTDLMGEQRTFRGSLKYADLTGATIRIDVRP